MSLTTALRTLLLADDTLRDLVGDRIYPDAVPVGVGPELDAVTYEQGRGRPEQTIDGPSTLQLGRVQYDVTGPNRDRVDRIGQEIVRILDGYSGAANVTRDPASQAVAIDDLTVDNDYAGRARPRKGSDNPLRRRTVDFVVSYQRELTNQPEA